MKNVPLKLTPAYVHASAADQSTAITESSSSVLATSN
jgi:hypothetical protein